MQRQTTIVTKEQALTNRKWYIVDATNKPLGRLASEVAVRLIGKDKKDFTPNVDCGDFIIVINASKVALSGDKENKKNYYNVSGYTGGLRTRSSGVMAREYPIEMVERAVWGMLPKGRLGRQIYKKLFVYVDGNHKQAAQNPEVLELKF